jgi:formylglycine-generating enzyme required for sulfatase activity
MDDTFLRQAAALQANLKMLESQSASLTDLADMKELRQFKARLADYIDGHAAAGNLPRDPFQVIEGRLRDLEDFFSATTRETKQLTSWRKDWLKAAPSVDLATLQGSLGELDAMAAEVPRIQGGLRAKISTLDWAFGSHTAELHQELLICASCVPGLELQKPARRQAAYEFAHGSGTLAEDLAKHFQAVGAQIREWMVLHATHARELAQIEQDVENHEVRSAERRWGALGDAKFKDLDYTSAESGVKKLQGILQRFTGCNEQLNGRIAKGEFGAVEQEFVHLEQSITIPDSELGQEALAVLGQMKSRLAAAKAKRRKQRIRVGFFAAAGVVAIAAAGIKIQNDARREQGIGADLRAKVEHATAELQSKQNANRAGEEHEFEIAPGVRMGFCWCPAGDFIMGSAESEESRSENEYQARVTLGKGFWMGKTEVTQAQWESVMGENPSKFKGANRPVENVSWNDAQEFLEKLNDRLGNADGGKMVLPTDAQWEYAARAGQTGGCSGGSLDEVAWYARNSGNESHPVATKKANAWGLHDMSGNVWEWCQDWYDDKLSGGANPGGPSSGAIRVHRGGGWFSDASSCRVAFRNGNNPAYADGNIGARVVRSSVP